MHYGISTAEYMYPALKINKDFEWGMLENLTLKKKKNDYIHAFE